MHKLIEYVCDELKEYEKKAEKTGKLSVSEVQFVDTLAHLKKNLLTAEAMGEGEGYSNESSYANRSSRRGSYNSYERSQRSSYEPYERSQRSNANYSRSAAAKEDLLDELRNLQAKTRDNEAVEMVSEWIRQLEG